MGIAMSNIPQARAILMRAQKAAPEEMRQGIRDALALMVRRLPAYRFGVEHEPLAPSQRRQARRLHRVGWSIERIARELGTNTERVSEAINE